MVMVTYIYESVPPSSEEPVERFEIQQSMMDDPLRVHPETGQVVRRVVTGGFGYAKSGGQAPPSGSGGCCRPGGCSCN